jgi:hypothetical protein
VGRGKGIPKEREVKRRQEYPEVIHPFIFTKKGREPGGTMSRPFFHYKRMKEASQREKSVTMMILLQQN